MSGAPLPRFPGAAAAGRRGRPPCPAAHRCIGISARAGTWRVARGTEDHGTRPASGPPPRRRLLRFSNREVVVALGLAGGV
ncbi:hypothetical protein F3J18_33920, partial [Burkholderia sp. Ax-1720]|nr:hypothetical protein [Burkholderia sp. Ax-1720]